MKNQNTRRGFTLIELLIVVLIIGILTTIAVPQYQKAVAKARLVEIATHARSIHQGMEIYHLANGVSPSMMADIDVWDSIQEISSTSGAELATIGNVEYKHDNKNINYFYTTIALPGIEDIRCEFTFSTRKGACNSFTEKGRQLLSTMGWIEDSPTWALNAGRHIYYLW